MKNISNLGNAKRISVIGISASGKSTFSKQLSAQIGIPLFHMDSLFWGSGWLEIAEQDWLTEEQKIINYSQWIIEGYIDEKYFQRLIAADFIIYLDISGHTAVVNALKRWWKYKHSSRPELNNCPEKFDINFLWHIFMRKERGEIERAITNAGNQHLLRLKTKKEIRSFFNKLP